MPASQVHMLIHVSHADTRALTRIMFLVIVLQGVEPVIASLVHMQKLVHPRNMFLVFMLQEVEIMLDSQVHTHILAH